MSIILNYINYFWKLGYNEEISDIYIKKYHGFYNVKIDMANDIIDYGNIIQLCNDSLAKFSQKNFVILECVNRLLEKGYHPNSLIIGKNDSYDIAVKDNLGRISIAINCTTWEDDYENEVTSIKTNAGFVSSFFERNPDMKYLCVYTSRLKAGLIEYKNTIFSLDNKQRKIIMYLSGLFEENIKPYFPIFIKRYDDDKDIKNIKTITKIGDFEIENDVLIKYTGNDRNVIIPDGVKRLGNGVFWNCIDMISLVIPNSVTSLGGDTFYNCVNLENLTIPNSIEVMGDNPFANCPNLELINNSTNFIFENGALYNKEKSRLIYYSIKNNADIFAIPDGLISIGKHAFYNCTNLKKIIIPKSVAIMENNPFSNCPSISLENHTPNFIFDNGALYNKPKTTLIYYAINNTSKSFVIPDGVKIIGRHSFYNCCHLSSITIPSSVEIIGYNPFTNCSSLARINNNSPNYIYENGVLYDKTKTELIYYSICNPLENFVIPNTVTSIGRSAFAGCINLKSVVIPDGVKSIAKSAFANCPNLTSINIPSSVNSLEEWAFYNCSKLTSIDIPKHTKIEGHTFYKCVVKISRS